ncbi:MAG: D-alanyl-D-alanine carboxypeptidase family protein [Chloroflexota bacterium]
MLIVLGAAFAGTIGLLAALRAVAPAHAATGSKAAAAAPASDFYSAAWLTANPGPDLGLQAAAAVVADLDTHRLLWARDPATPRAPASLAKMVTAMVAVDLAGLDRTLTVPPEATGVEPNLMGLAPGDVVSVRELLYGLFLDSGNDAAEALGQAIVPRARFIADMNAKAGRWGLKGTTFANPSGLDDPGLRSTPYDLAVIAGHLATEYPALMEIAGTREHSIPATPQHRAYAPYNLNKMLATYPGSTGLKTGLTDDAGGCVVVTATRNGRRLVAVVMRSDIFFTDAARLLDYGFSTRQP